MSSVDLCIVFIIFRENGSKEEKERERFLFFGERLTERYLKIQRKNDRKRSARARTIRFPLVPQKTRRQRIRFFLALFSRAFSSRAYSRRARDGCCGVHILFLVSSFFLSFFLSFWRWILSALSSFFFVFFFKNRAVKRIFVYYYNSQRYYPITRPNEVKFRTKRCDRLFLK